MKAPVHRYSLLKRMIWLILIVYSLMVLLTTFFITYIINFTQQKIADQLSATLSNQNQQIKTELDNATAYINSFAIGTSAIKTLELNQKNTDYYSAIYLIQSELNTALASMRLPDGFFIFPINSGQLITSSAVGTSTTTSGIIRAWARKAYQDNVLTEYAQNKWFPLAIEDHYIFIRVLRFGDLYVGVWTDFNKLLSLITANGTVEYNAYYTFGDSLIINIVSQSEGSDFAEELRTNGTFQIVQNQRDRIILMPIDYADNAALFLRVPDYLITRQLQGIYIILLISGLLIILFAIAAIWSLRKYLQRPINQLLVSIQELRAGDFSTCVDNKYACVEFEEVNVTFNDMAKNIHTLKINAYEEQLNRQAIEYQALKNQVAPHFLLNCLNSLYYLSAGDDVSKTQSMIIHLSNHLRYALADAPTVSLAEEIAEVENYVALSKIRFPNVISYYSEVDATILDAQFLPMTLLFQAENIIKHAINNDQVTEIHLQVHPITDGDAKKIRLCIWDTGEGFNKEFLTMMLTGTMQSNADGHHIGVKNTVQRMKHFWGEDFSIGFSNRENAGAQIEYIIPYVPQLPY